MAMSRWLLCAAALCAAPVSAQEPGRSAQGDVRVTVYNNNLALVQDTRRLTLPAGRSRQEFADVSAQIRPETVSFEAAGVGIVEQNFDYDLLSPSSLMEKAVGKTITIVRVNPATGAETREQATVLSVNGGVVLRIGNRIEVLRDDGLPVRVIFDRIPENLRARPTLSVTVNASGAGTRPATLSYLTPGMSWKADYVALFDEPAGRIDVQGWVTLNNRTGTSFANADTLLVAGEVTQEQSVDEYGNYRPPPPPRAPRRTLRQAGTETAGREQLGDFYLYPLAGRTTIANAQTKQVSFLDVAGAPGRRAYEYRNEWLGTRDQAESADTVLRFSSSRAGGLGDALPAGIVRVYMKDAKGQAQFVGENRIDHTPMGSDIGLKTGEAFDVKVQPVVEKREALSPFRYRTTMRYTLTNARAQPVEVELAQAGLDFGFDDTRIVSESQRGRRRSSNEVEWTVRVPANGSAMVTATFETRY